MTQFSDLPAEVRIMIWTATFPGPRVIEPTIRVSAHPRRAHQCLRLQPIASLPTFLASETTYLPHRRFDDPPIERCDDPVALHVCRESRAQTRASYIPVIHDQGATPFYFSPGKDLFWLAKSTLIKPDMIPMLKTCYREAWDRIERVLVEEKWWIEFTTACERDGIIKLFEGLRTVEVMVAPGYDAGKGPKRPEHRLGQLDAEVARRWGN